MNDSTHTNSLSDLVEGFNNEARIPALKAIVHSSLARCIGHIRQHMRNQALAARDEDVPQVDLDARNSHDENFRAPNDISEELGFQTPVPPMRLASAMHAVYELANADLQTLATSKWDNALSVEQMLEFMIDKADVLDPITAEALAKAVKTDVKHIEKLHDLQNQRERELLKEAKPEILATFHGFGSNGYAEALDDVPPFDQHQMAVKVAGALGKARDQTLMRVLRSRRLSDLGAIPIIEDALEQTRTWVSRFETKYADVLQEAADAGRTVHSLED